MTNLTLCMKDRNHVFLNTEFKKVGFKEILDKVNHYGNQKFQDLTKPFLVVNTLNSDSAFSFLVIPPGSGNDKAKAYVFRTVIPKRYRKGKNDFPFIEKMNAIMKAGVRKGFRCEWLGPGELV